MNQPTRNAEFWAAKIVRNQERDAESVAQLTAMGWRVLIVWECEVGDVVGLTSKLEAFLACSSGG